MDIEKEVTSYLLENGDTRESDITKWGCQKFDYSPKGMKKAIARMIKSGKIHRIVHSQLKPPGVYLSIREHKKIDYSELEPERALLVARIDWFLDNFDLFFGNLDEQSRKKLVDLMKLTRDYHYREGKAIGR